MLDASEGYFARLHVNSGKAYAKKPISMTEALASRREKHVCIAQSSPQVHFVLLRIVKHPFAEIHPDEEARRCFHIRHARVVQQGREMQIGLPQAPAI